jgi:15-cis-phytoene synthase
LTVDNPAVVSESPLDDAFVNRAAPPGSMRYFALLYAPAERRASLTSLLAIDTEIRDAARSASHDVAHTRLQWWRGEVDRLVNGSPQHPAARALYENRRGATETFGKLHELLVAADMDLARMTYANALELRAYCARSAGSLAELIATELSADGALDEATRAAAYGMGIGIRQAEMLRDLRQDAHDGRIYLPLDQLEQHSVAPAELDARELGKNVRAVLRSFKDSAEHELTVPPLEPSQRDLLRPLVVLAALHRRLLQRIAARDYDVASERIELGPVEKPWIAWRAARKAK